MQESVQGVVRGARDLVHVHEALEDAMGKLEVNLTVKGVIDHSILCLERRRALESEQDSSEHVATASQEGVPGSVHVSEPEEARELESHLQCRFSPVHTVFHTQGCSQANRPKAESAKAVRDAMDGCGPDCLTWQPPKAKEASSVTSYQSGGDIVDECSGTRAVSKRTEHHLMLAVEGEAVGYTRKPSASPHASLDGLEEDESYDDDYGFSELKHYARVHAGVESSSPDSPSSFNSVVEDFLTAYCAQHVDDDILSEDAVTLGDRNVSQPFDFIKRSEPLECFYSSPKVAEASECVIRLLTELADTKPVNDDAIERSLNMVNDQSDDLCNVMELLERVWDFWGEALLEKHGSLMTLHDEVIVITRQLANDVGADGNLRAKANILWKLYRVQIEIGREDGGVYRTLQDLANACGAMGEFEKERQILEEIVCKIETDQMGRLLLFRDLARATGAAGQPDEAIEAVQEILVKLEELCGGLEHIEVARTILLLADMLKAQGQTEAMKCYRSTGWRIYEQLSFARR